MLTPSWTFVLEEPSLKTNAMTNNRPATPFLNHLSQQQTARVAGWLYLTLIICGVFYLVYIPSKLIVWENAATTVENIRNAEQLFRWGVVSGIVSFLAFLLMSLALFKLLRHINTALAWLLLVFVLVSIPLTFSHMLHHFSVLSLISQPGYLQKWDAVRLQEEVMIHLESFNHGVLLSNVFWGLWLFPFGLLVFQSGFLPKILGILLVLGGGSYLVDFVGRFLFPSYSNSILLTLMGVPATLGEFGICLWLIILGTKPLTFGRKRATLTPQENPLQY